MNEISCLMVGLMGINKSRDVFCEVWAGWHGNRPGTEAELLLEAGTTIKGWIISII